MRLSFALLLIALLVGSARAEPPTLSYTVVARYPHDPHSFTQGLEIDGAALYESSGLYGQSFIARQPLPGSHSPTASDRPAATAALPPRFFGEGLTLWDQRIYVVTWREQQGFVFDRQSLQKIGEFHYQGEGWGLTHNAKQLILSNGSAVLQFIDPHSFALEKSLTVSSDGVPLDQLNELEWIDDPALGAPRLLANIWQSDTIVAIDPSNGRVTARLDLSQLYPHGQRSPHADVLNGIAVDARDHTLLITGKLWPYLYRIRLSQALP